MRRSVERTTAFPRISRSICSSRTCLRSFASSSRSSLVRPVWPLLRSARARSTQTRSAEAVRSRSRATPQTVLPSSSTSRTAPALNSSVKLRRTRFGLFPSSMIDTVSASRLVSTKTGEAQPFNLIDNFWSQPWGSTWMLTVGDIYELTSAGWQDRGRRPDVLIDHCTFGLGAVGSDGTDSFATGCWVAPSDGRIWIYRYLP